MKSFCASTISLLLVISTGGCLSLGFSTFSNQHRPVGSVMALKTASPSTSNHGIGSNKKPNQLLFGNPRKETINNQRKQVTSVVALQESLSGDSEASRVVGGAKKKLPTFFYRLNASTKWLVSVANTLGIWMRLHSCEGPLIVVGAIAAVYFTDALKQILNHDRPAGAPFTDPGMPSSHSLVSFFMAAAWTSLVFSTTIPALCIWSGASIVALLRVICGYHSYDQIAVGAVLGSTMGFLWARLGQRLVAAHPNAMFQLSWCLYIAGSALFIAKNMREWVTKHKHL